MDSNHPTTEQLTAFAAQVIAKATTAGLIDCLKAKEKREIAFQKAFVAAINKNGTTKDKLECLGASICDTDQEQKTGADIELSWRSSPTEKTTCFLQVKMVYRNKTAYDEAVSGRKLSGSGAYAPYFALDTLSSTGNHQLVTLSNYVVNAVKGAKEVPDLPQGFNLYSSNSRHITGGYVVVNISENNNSARLLHLHRIGAVLGGITPTTINKLKPEGVTDLYYYHVTMNNLPTLTEVIDNSALNDFLPVPK